MFGKHPLAEAASLFSDPARVAILTRLMGGESRPAGELARSAGLSPQAASAHLARLTESGILTLQPSGRHRYYRISSVEVVHAMEALAAIAPLPRAPAHRESEPDRALRHARTCYNHLAGRVAVAMWDAIVEVQAGEPALSARGLEAIGELGIDLADLRGKKRPFAKACLDWTERKNHLAGALGEALLTCFLSRGWLARRPGSRALRVTAPGECALIQLFNAPVR